MKETTKDRLVYVGLVGAIIAVFWFIGYTTDKRAERFARAEVQRKEAVCPSFLSIARSARDTLIVMRNEPLCNRYVLDNLK